MDRRTEILLYAKGLSDKDIQDRAKLIFYLNTTRLGVKCTVKEAVLVSGGSMDSAYTVSMAAVWNKQLLESFQSAAWRLERAYSRTDEDQLSSDEMSRLAERAGLASGQFTLLAERAAVLDKDDYALYQPLRTVLDAHDLSVLRADPTDFAVVGITFRLHGDGDDS